LTGERPQQGVTPDSLLALHEAGYRAVLDRIGSGRILDVGCGQGFESARFLSPDREVVGADYSSEAVATASTRYRSEGLRVAQMNAFDLGLGTASFDGACSSHLIEHFTDPEPHVAELARVVRDDGVACVLTPNAPADFENPFHVYPFEPDHLMSLLSLFFEDVTCYGLEGDDVLKADFAKRRASGERLLRLDRLDLRLKMPRGAYVWAYEHILPLTYRFLGNDSGIGSGIDQSHFSLSDKVHSDTPVLFAVARKPRAVSR
jgi:SAM-dependent methyltransferase